jgi:hypothetical protein
MGVVFCQSRFLSFKPHCDLLFFFVESHNQIENVVVRNAIDLFGIYFRDGVPESQPFPLLIGEVTFFLIHLNHIDSILLDNVHLLSCLSKYRFVTADHEGIFVEKLQMFLILDPTNLVPDDFVPFLLLVIASVVQLIVEKGHFEVDS